MKTYLEITISASEEQREMLIPTMVESGCKGFEETESSLICYVPIDRWDPEQLVSYKNDVRSLLRTISSNADVLFREMEDRNWNEEWEKTIQPINVTDRMVIKPSWSTGGTEDGKIVIQIDPKMSFGTGYHETTRLTLRMLESFLKPGWKLLDVGTGTGVLAIAAIKLGGSAAIGTDIDEWALTNAAENVKLNGLGERITIVNAAVAELPKAGFDIITANLTLSTNIDLLEDFHATLRPGGILLLSGLLAADRIAMMDALRTESFRIIDERSENEWIGVAAARI